jgi:hypothetical protein
MKNFIHKPVGKGLQIFFAALVFFCLGSVLGADSKAKDQFSYFVGFEKFSRFKKSAGETNNEIVLTSPELSIPINWNELVASWNADAPSGSYLKIEARGIYPDHATKFYSLGIWSPDSSAIERQSVRGQKDADGNVDTDTLILNKPGAKTQMRVTLGASEKNQKPILKFLGLSFCDGKAQCLARPPFKAAWGKETAIIERSQNSYPDEKGWCSPTSVSMVLTHYAETLKRPEMSLDVPQIVPAVFDKNWGGTGNWPFNTAFIGSFKGMRSYVTRFSDISELEQWTAAGFPVIISSPWALLLDGRKNTGNGHIVVCTGFTENGDVVINDPGTNVEKERVRHVYKRQNVINAWSKSKNTVYLVYPESAKIPKDTLNHWEK